MQLSEREMDEIVQICSCYESGFNAGRMKLSSDNNPHMNEKLYMSWMLGHNIGVQLDFMEYDEGWIN